MDGSALDGLCGRSELRESLWRVSSLPRCRKCGVVVFARPVVEVNAEGRARVVGVASCRSVWACPVCSAPIRAGRAAEVAAGLQSLMGEGCGVLFVTLTLPHDFGDELALLLPAMKRAWSTIVQARFGMGLRSDFGIVGLIRALEVTLGPNGWHPHLHVLFVFSSVLDDYAVSLFDATVFARWVTGVVAQGYREPTRQHGVVTRRVADANEIANYVAKVETMLGAAIEVAAANIKRGRAGNLSPFELLSFAGQGDARAAMEFRNFEQAFFGSRAVLWSPGLKRRANVIEVPDQELIEADGGEFRPLFPIAVPLWNRVVRTPGFYRGLYRSIEAGYTSGGEQLGAELGADFVAGLLCQSMEVAA